MTAPYVPQKVSILDRLMGKLFPTSALLDPESAQMVQRQGLRQFGANLMQAGGASPQQRGTLANIGASLGGVDVNELTKNALALQAYQRERATNQAIGAAIARHPPQSGEVQADVYKRLTALAGDLAAIPGAEGVLAKLAPVLQAVKPDREGEPQRVTGVVDTRPRSPTLGQTGTFLIPYPGAPREQWTFLREGQKEKEPTPAERVAGSQLDAATASVAHMREIARRNPNAAKAAVAAIQAGGWGKVGKAYAALRGFTNDQDANDFYTEYKNMLLTVTPTYGASRPTQQLMDLEQAATLPAIGSGNFDAAFSHMEHRLQDLRAKAGHASGPAPRHGTYSADNPFPHP